MTHIFIKTRLDNLNQARAETMFANLLNNPALSTSGVGMAPEQFMGVPVDSKADQHYLGVLFFEMLTGRQPFPDENPVDLLRKHMSVPLPFACELKPEIPEAWDQLIGKMTH